MHKGINSSFPLSGWRCSEADVTPVPERVGSQVAMDLGMGDAARDGRTTAVGVTSSDAHVGRPPPAGLGAMLHASPSTGSAAR
eukprot:2139586-Prymnesium_polylepis.1